MAKNHNEITIFRAGIKIVVYTFKSWPIALIIFLLIALSVGVMNGLNIWVMQYAFEAVTEMNLGLHSINWTILPLILFIGFIVGQSLLATIRYLCWAVIHDRTHGYMCKQVALKTAKLDPILFEDPKILDDINRASEATHKVFWVANIIITIFIQHLPMYLIMSVYLFTLNPILIFVIILAFVPKILSQVIRAKLYTDLEERSAPLRRESDFYEEAMVDRQYFKETRLLGAFGFFKEKYFKVIKLLNRETWKADARAATFDLVAEALTAAGYFGILYLLFISLRDGSITAGAFAAVLASVSQLIAHIDFLITGCFANVAEDIGKINYLIRFFDLPEKIGADVEVNWSGDIEFKNVNFTYPNAKKPSLKDLSLTIKAGETIAIVGENGAGKSTLIKLLLGLYEPTSGEIVVSNQNLQNIMPQRLFTGASAVFQKYQRYQMTLKENLQISTVNTNRDVLLALEKAGVEWESCSYPDGLDTMLSREFDGVDLSGGQWQRISIARGLYRQHDLIVLDEPTAAIDPLEESRLYKKFYEITKDKTAVIVTHRLGSAQIADKIIVLTNGQISEIGTHQELLEQKGHYTLMYESQMSWYIS